MKVPNLSDNEVITKYLSDQNLSVQEFTARLKDGKDEKVLEVYNSAIENQRVAQSSKTLMCLIQICEISLTRSLKESVPHHIQTLFDLFAVEIPTAILKESKITH